jgi:putative transposase
MIKGGFSRRASLDLSSKLDIWQRGFSDHRIRDGKDYEIHKTYIAQNPVKKGLCDRADEYPYGGASGGYVLDPCPQGLKPVIFRD